MSLLNQDPSRMGLFDGRRATHIFLLLLWVMFQSAELAHAQEIQLEKYAWEFPTVTGISGVDDLIDELRDEIQTILKAGHLAPLDLRYADLMPNLAESHFLYLEPGRIITTLAWAYPHLTASQQTAVRRYVTEELNDERFAPWGNYPLPKEAGARRELHPMDRVWGAEFHFGKNRPCLHTLYGLWLYGYRSGDWATVQPHWSQIKQAYEQRAAQGTIYGTLGAPIAMARLAGKFGDGPAQAQALTNLQAGLTVALSFATVENLCRTQYYPEFYEARRTQGVYNGWMFLNLTPEIGRYLREQVREPVMARHETGKSMYPLWWLHQAPYFCRWTGDEGVGLSAEIVGMIAPVERWVAQSDAKTLRSYTRSTPTGRGDCYWIEMLVQAIEASGSIRWTDVRSSN